MRISNSAIFGFFVLSLFSSAQAKDYIQGQCEQISPEGYDRTGEDLSMTQCWYGTSKNDKIEIVDGKIFVNAHYIGDYLPRFKNEFYGLDGRDDIEGGEYNDRLFGGQGKDYLNGGGGNDSLSGGKNSDMLQGGPGVDTYAPPYGYDTIIPDLEDKIPIKSSNIYVDEGEFMKYLECYHELADPYGEKLNNKTATKFMEACTAQVLNGIHTKSTRFQICASHAQENYYHNPDVQEGYSEYLVSFKSCLNDMLAQE